jgi:nucleoid-associated protein YgaU
MFDEEGAMRKNPVLTICHVLVVPVLLVLVAGCAGRMPQEVVDVNRGLGEAKDACAGVYAADDLQEIQGEVDAMNELADAKKYRKARKAADPILPGIGELSEAAASARADAKAEAEAAIEAAASALSGAADAEAPALVSSAYQQAEEKLSEARRLFDDPCKYDEAMSAARDAARLADNATQAAQAERKRLEEEERKRAEEEARRKAEEARRLEEERLKMFPPTHVVERGDSLWRISGMENIYDNPIYWPIIHDANGGMISDPDLIYPGQELTIPRGMEQQGMDEKLHMLWRNYATGEAEEE